MINEIKNESELHLEAMLYLLNDPTLDRVSFELRLSEDARLGEILADAVTVYQSLKSIDLESLNDSNLLVPSSVTPASAINPSAGRLWLTLGTVAASFLLIGFLGWQSIYPNSLRSVSMRNSANANVQISDAIVDSDFVSMSSLLSAWGELRTGDRDEHLRSLSCAESECLIAMSEPFSESDVPEWLVLATSTTFEDSNAADTQIESRNLLQ